MGIVTVPKFLLPPPWLEGFPTSVALDASDKRIACVFAVPKSGTLDKFEFLTGTTVSVNAASVIRVSFRDLVNSTGEPSGVTDQYRDILGSALSANTWISPGLMTSDGTDGGVKRVVTRGDLLVIVIEYQSFTGGDDLDIQELSGRGTSGAGGSCEGFPYNLFQSAGSWDRDPAAIGPPLFALKYSDGTYGRPIAPGLIGASTVSVSPAFNSGSTPDERGNIFTILFPIRVTGAWVSVDPAVAASDFQVVLVDTNGTTELEAVAVDGAQPTGAAEPRFIPFAAVHELAIGTYRLTIRPTTVNNVSVKNVTVSATAILESVFNLSFYGTSRTGAGAWTEEDTRFYLLGLVVDGLEEGASAAGAPASGILSDRGFRRGMIS